MGYQASHEQFKPGGLVKWSIMAEKKWGTFLRRTGTYRPDKILYRSWLPYDYST